MGFSSKLNEFKIRRFGKEILRVYAANEDEKPTKRQVNAEPFPVKSLDDLKPEWTLLVPNSASENTDDQSLDWDSLWI